MIQFPLLRTFLLCALFTFTLVILFSVNTYLNLPTSEHQIQTLPPDFASFTNTKEKKRAFFDYLQPMVEKSNNRVLNQRARLDKISISLQNDKLKKTDLKFLNELAEKYGVDAEHISNNELIQQLKIRVDGIPVSLALAQAAKESGWGTSRFARQANNYFGQWCYTEGCGLLPNRRPDGTTHEVRKFDLAAESVEAYIRNLNTHKTYQSLRETRVRLRSQGITSGLQLAEGLSSYSQRGKAYVKEVQSMIRFNELDRFDQFIN